MLVEINVLKFQVGVDIFWNYKYMIWMLNELWFTLDIPTYGLS